ncbi:MAG: bifunctional ornithine acetyltransferase/N-acetylglutamate synthase [Enterococcus sp.]
MKEIVGTISSPQGFVSGAVHSGVKKKRKDLGIIYSNVPASVAGVYTTNLVKAAPVTVNQEKIAASQKIQAIVVNSGNANACTGEQGTQNAYQMAELTAEKLGIAPELVAIGSTGIIGKQLAMDKITQGIQAMDLATNDDAFAEAILTTDTFTKTVTVEEEIAGKKILISGVAKGSGMIHPNMATMLSYITTDATISSQNLQNLLSELTEITFNQITVDGDTSTNDTVLVLANAQAGGSEILPATLEFQQFKVALRFVMTKLAKLIAQDGEGATKLIEVTVNGAENASDARMAAKAIVGSSLVKTAIFGKDPNWGRILCSLGYSGAQINPAEVSLILVGQVIMQDGIVQEFNQTEMANALAQEVITIEVELKQGDGMGKAWGCDLTYDYVKINALYTT